MTREDRLKEIREKGPLYGSDAEFLLDELDEMIEQRDAYGASVDGTHKTVLKLVAKVAKLEVIEKATRHFMEGCHKDWDDTSARMTAMKEALGGYSIERKKE